MKKATFSTLLVTAYLIVFTVLTHTNTPIQVLFLLFALWPVGVIWMTFSILKDKSTTVKELDPEEEWGYADRDKSSLGVF